MACRRRHPSVSESATVCVPCQVSELIRLERKTLKEVVDWIRDRGLCFYCGENATEIEHVIPQRLEYPTWTVMSCRECNSLAGGEAFVSALDKARYIRDRRERRYRDLLRMPEWDDEELQEMGPTMRRSIRTHQRARDIVRCQLTWEPISAFEMLATQG
jgi:hypothetical protein